MEFTSIGNAKKQTGLQYLGGVNISSKLTKNGKVGQATYGVYLAPASTSGYNVCLHSTPECRLGCLNTSGRAAIDIFSGITRIADARVKKTKLFHEEQTFFMNWLVAEIQSNKRKAEAKGLFFSVRLNCTSDIDWATIKHNSMNIFEIYPDVQFYDYTKQITKLFNPIANYHLTLSYTGYKDNIYQSMLKSGNNVAVVFNVKHEADLPETFMGFPVVNGDYSDFRPNDGSGVVVGLKWKRIADRKTEQQILNSVFVVQPTDARCGYDSELTEYIEYVKQIKVHELAA
jgi:hypothetical protein